MPSTNKMKRIPELSSSNPSSAKNSEEARPCKPSSAEDSVSNDKKPVISKAKNLLEEVRRHSAFHGFITEAEIQSNLKSKGDWLICNIIGSAEKGALFLCIKSNDPDEILKLVLSQSCEGVSLSVPPSKRGRRGKQLTPYFRHLRSILEHYKVHAILDDAALGERCKRPRWMLECGKLRYRQKEYLGIGNFGFVCRGSLVLDPFGVGPAKSSREIEVAIKAADKSAGKEPKRSEIRQSQVREATLMSELQNFHLISYYGISYDESCMAIAVEICPGGSLVDYLATHGESIGLEERIYYLMEIAKGVEFIHSRDYLHRDLAARNCLISANGRIKISDFGLMCSVKEAINDDVAADVNNAPIRWLSPEVVTAPSRYSFKSDIWAYGMLVYEVCLNGKQPWDGQSAGIIKKCISRLKMPVLPQETPEIFHDLLKTCWQKEEDRCSSFNLIIRLLRDARQRIASGQNGIHQAKRRTTKPEFTIYQLPNVKYVDDVTTMRNYMRLRAIQKLSDERAADDRNWSTILKQGDSKESVMHRKEQGNDIKLKCFSFSYERMS